MCSWLHIMYTKSFQRVFLFIAFALISLSSHAQCAMCKASAESNAEGGGSIASGLNEGILWLMFFPYFLAMTIGYLWYRHNKRTKNEVSEEN